MGAILYHGHDAPKPCIEGKPMSLTGSANPGQNADLTLSNSQQELIITRFKQVFGQSKRGISEGG